MGVGMKARVGALLAVLAVVAGLSGIGSPAAGLAGSAAATAPTSVTFNSQRLAVTTSTHQSLWLSVSGVEMSHSSGEVMLELETHNQRESHQWEFQLGKGSVHYNVKTGKGSISSGSQIEPFGTLNLALTAQPGSRALHCAPKSEVVTRHLAVSGTVSFQSHALAWGHLGGAHKHLAFGSHGSIQLRFGPSDCTPPQKCPVGIEWISIVPDELTEGVTTLRHGQEAGTLTVEHETALSNPTGANRLDEVVVRTPAPALTVQAGVPILVVDTAGDGATGNAELTSAQPAQKSTGTCGKHKLKLVSWGMGSLTNGDQPLEVHEQIEGTLTVPNSTSEVGFAEFHEIG